MRTAFVYIFIYIIGASPSSFALENWSVCQESSDCIVSEELCYSPVSINKRFLKENEQNNKQQRPLIQCLEYKGPSKEKYKAVCKEKKCFLELK